MNEYDRWKTESREDEQTRLNREYPEARVIAIIPVCGRFKASFYARSICSHCGRAFTMHKAAG